MVNTKQEILRLARSIQADWREQQQNILKIGELVVAGLFEETADHKQWFFEQILEVLGADIEEWNAKGVWKEGIQPSTEPCAK